MHFLQLWKRDSRASFQVWHNKDILGKTLRMEANASRKLENLTTQNIILEVSIAGLPVEVNLCLLYVKYVIYGCKYIENKKRFTFLIL